MLRAWVRQLIVVLAVLVVASCSGSGCSGCSGCGVTPLPNGFPKPQAVDNAGSIRITRSGLDFVGDNLGTVAGKALGQGGVLHFNIPSSTSTQTFLGIFSITVKICPNGPNPNATPPECIADIDLANAKLHLDSATYVAAGNKPALRISGTIPLRVQNLPLNITTLGDAGVGVGQAGNPACNGGTPNFDYFQFPIEILLPLISETISPRDGFMKIDTKNAVINPTIDKNNIALCKNCGGIFTQFCNAFLGWVKDLVFNSLISPLTGQIKTALEDQLCTKPNANVTPQCPTGTQVSGGKCVYTSDPTTCVPTMLGTEGHMDLSSALAKFSPGTSGGLDFVLAAGGDMNPAPNAAADNVGWPGHTPNGATLGLLGGVAAMPTNGCVPFADVKPPTGIPIPDEMLSNTIAPWPMNTAGPHLGIALAGRFLDYSMAGVYNSGLLCLGVSTEQVAQLQSGLISFLIPGVKMLTFERKPAPIAITTRPQSPPTIKIGTGADIKTDPLLLIQMPKFSIDFYVWSMDRFVRAFTFTGDLGIPVNLQTAKNAQNPNGGLLPILGDIQVANPLVTNSDLLIDDPKVVATSLAGLLGGIAGQFLGAIKPVDLSNSLASFGLGLTIPDGGVRKLSKNTDDYVAIFANLGLAKMNALVEADVQARLVGKTVHAEAMAIGTMNRDLAPTLRVLASSSLDDGSRAIEYSWRIDEGTRSAWTAGRDITVRSDGLFLQGKHVLSVFARVKGDPSSESTVPAAVPFTIDVLPPSVAITDTRTTAKVDAWDFVSPQSALLVRVERTDANGKSELGRWVPYQELDLGDLGAWRTLTVEVKDEEGNIGKTSAALIRGRPDGTIASSGSGCGCSTPGAAPPASWAWSLPALAGLFALAWRRRRRAAGPGQESPPAGRPFPVSELPTSRGSQLRGVGLAAASLVAVGLLDPGCDCGGAKPPDNRTHCGPDCNTPCQEGLPVGIIGAYTSAAVAKDGSIWFSGYNDAVLSGGFSLLYGDLVVGKFDAAKQKVMWRSVDGLPPARTDGTCPDNDSKGWRRGETDPGDDVGLWTSMQLDDTGHALVAYYDATNAALKFAVADDTGSAAYEILRKPNADVGRYVKMLMVNGSPVLAFLLMEKGNGGKLRSKIVVARASKPAPIAATDWTFEDAAVDEDGPCRAAFCGPGESCIKATGACQPSVTGCTPADCGAGNACVTIANQATCSPVVPKDGVQSYVNATGLYVSLANGPQGLGIVAYDRVRGNLMGVSNAGGKWTAQILDGQTGANNDPMRIDTGDVGITASLVIAPNGDWHVAYVNGIQERLQYLLVPGGGKPLAPELVDDGLDGGKPWSDGKHIVGDDATLRLDTSSGTVTIAYQDATLHVLRVATGTLQQNATHKWTARTIAQTVGAAGYFPRLIQGSQVSNFYWQTNHQTAEIFGDVAVTTF